VDQVADFFETNAGNVNPVAVPVVEAVGVASSLSSLGSSGVGSETGSIRDVQESE